MKTNTKLAEYVVSNMSSNRFKYGLFIYAVCAVHVSFIALFAALGVWPMVIFNLGSVATYVICSSVIRYGYEKNIIYTFYATYIEIIVHAFVATICIGWKFGFPHYLIGLVPFGYYICVTMMKGKRKYVIATILGFISYASFIFCRMITGFIGCIYQLDVSDTTESLIYSYNATCNFAFLFMVTLIFVADVQITTNKLHLQNSLLDNMANIDPLTGLYNRRSMHTFLDAASGADEPFSLVMCDIDNFKRVNDTYGHDFGDVVLRDIAHIIQQLVDTNGYVCRWGGEEILILYIGSVDDTCKVSENIRINVEKHSFSLHNTTIHCSLTLGIASHTKGSTIEDTITHADGRLYYGKQNGKNRVVSPYDK